MTINQARGQADPTATGPIHFTVLFSEPVKDFTGTDVTLNGTAGATLVIVTPTKADGKTYHVAVSGMTRSGTVIAGLAVGECRRQLALAVHEGHCGRRRGPVWHANPGPGRRHV